MREHAISEGFDNVGTWNLVNVRDKNHIALVYHGRTFQRGKNLIHHGVPRKVLSFPGILEVLAGHVEDVMDDLVMVFGETLPVVPHVQRLRSVFEVNGGLEDDEVVDFSRQFA